LKSPQNPVSQLHLIRSLFSLYFN